MRVSEWVDERTRWARRLNEEKIALLKFTELAPVKYCRLPCTRRGYFNVVDERKNERERINIVWLFRELIFLIYVIQDG